MTPTETFRELCELAAIVGVLDGRVVPDILVALVPILDDEMRESEYSNYDPSKHQTITHGEPPVTVMVSI